MRQEQNRSWAWYLKKHGAPQILLCLNLHAKESIQWNSRILNKEVILKNVALEKYGRLLADVYYDGTHFNQWMIDQRYAVEYSGGTKNSPPDWVKYHKGKK